MKKIVFTLTFFITTLSFAQSSKKATTTDDVSAIFPIDSTTNLITYTNVIKVEGLDKAGLFDRAQAWIKTYYKNPQQVTKQADKEAGTIELYYGFFIMKDVKGTQIKGDFIRYTANLQFRDGRFKYTISKINVDRESYYGLEKWLKPEYNDDKIIQSNLQQISKSIDELIAEMTKNITPEKVKKEEEW